MNIGLLLGSPRIGGTEKQISLLADELTKQGHDVDVFFLDSKWNFRDDRTIIDFGNINQDFLGVRKWNKVWKNIVLTKLLKFKNIEILHMFNLEAIEFGKNAAKRASINICVGSVRGIRFAHDRKIARRLKSALNEVRRVTVNSESIQKHLVQNGICESGKVVLISNGIPSYALGSFGRQPNAPLCVLFAGTLKDVKDPMSFVEAGIEVLKSDKKCRFVIAGDGPLKAILLDRVKESGYKEAFEFLGSVRSNDVPYEKADIVVSTSLREGSSNTVLEALAHGVPVVGSDVGGTGEVLRKGDFGLLVEPRDVQATAKAIRLLLGNHDLRKKLGQNGHSYVAEHHSVRGMTALHMSLYENLRHE